MAYVLGPVIGEIGGSGTGGSEIDVINVDVEASGGSGSAVDVHTIDVQPGEFVLASFAGTVTPGSTVANNHPELTLGPVAAVRNSGQTGIAAILWETTTLRMIRAASSGTDHITGGVFVTRLDPEAL